MEEVGERSQQTNLPVGTSASQPPELKDQDGAMMSSPPPSPPNLEAQAGTSKRHQRSRHPSYLLSVSLPLSNLHPVGEMSQPRNRPPLIPQRLQDGTLTSLPLSLPLELHLDGETMNPLPNPPPPAGTLPSLLPLPTAILGQPLNANHHLPNLFDSISATFLSKPPRTTSTPPSRSTPFTTFTS